MSQNKEHSRGYYQKKDIVTGTLYHASRPLRFLGNSIYYGGKGVVGGLATAAFMGAIEYYSFFADPNFPQDASSSSWIDGLPLLIGIGGLVWAGASVLEGIGNAWVAGGDRNYRRRMRKEREKAQRTHK